MAVLSDARPLVLVHGLWDTPRLFRPLIQELELKQRPVSAPSLPHRWGAVPLPDLAQALDQQIQAHWGHQEIDILGFSMGGVISRLWLQELGGASRCRRFISVGSPQRGTFTAQWVPRWPFAGIADMKRGSALLNRLNGDLLTLQAVECISLFCRWDLTVLPGWQAVLPLGEHQAVPVITHRQLMRHPLALAQVIRTLEG